MDKVERLVNARDPQSEAFKVMLEGKQSPKEVMDDLAQAEEIIAKRDDYSSLENRLFGKRADVMYFDDIMDPIEMGHLAPNAKAPAAAKTKLPYYHQRRRF